MSEVRKMVVVPAELLDSVLNQSKITQNPIIRLQADLEREKSEIKPTNDEQSVIRLNELSHQDEIYQQTRKNEENRPIKIQNVIVDDKREKPLDHSKPHKLHRLRKAPKRKILKPRSSFLKTFYQYEPNIVSEETIEETVAGTSKKPRTITAPRNKKSSEPANLLSPKHTRIGKLYHK